MDWQALGAIGGACAGFVALLTMLTVVLRAVWRMASRFDQQDTTLKRQNDELAIIKHELFPNSGNSVRDRLDKNTKLTEENTRELKRLHRRVGQLRRGEK